MTKYNEIFRLKEMLEKAKIPFEFNNRGGAEFAHYQIRYPNSEDTSDKLFFSVVEGYGTYGAEQDKLEVMRYTPGLHEDDPGVTGWLSAEEVFKMIKLNYYGILDERGIVMQKIVKVVDDLTLELKEKVIEIDENNQEQDWVNKLTTALNCPSEELYKKYEAYKQAEAEFNELYDPFKKKIIAMHKTETDMPNTILVAGLKMTYVSPSVRTSIDTARLKEEEPALAKKYSKTSNVSATIRLEDTIARK